MESTGNEDSELLQLNNYEVIGLDKMYTVDPGLEPVTLYITGLVPSLRSADPIPSFFSSNVRHDCVSSKHGLIPESIISGTVCIVLGNVKA